MTDTVIFWFRRDLRLSDNEALLEASKAGNVLPVFVLDQGEAFTTGGASQWWLHHSLEALNKSLDGQLRLLKGDASQLIPQLAASCAAKAVYWNRCYEPGFGASDELIADQLTKDRVQTHAFEGTLLWPLSEVLKKDGTPFKVYKPFLRARLAADAPRPPLAKPRSIQFSTHKPAGSVVLGELALLPAIHWDAGIAAAWTPGEAAGKALLSSFVTSKLQHYREGRNFPAQDILSRLSPYLHYGEVSPGQVWHGVYQQASKQTDDATELFISEVCWRDFAYSLLFHFPATASSSYNERLKKLEWHDDAQRLKKWQQGQTGIPIVDAGMRQLWQTGYMHNRVRMITASFLIKNLLIDWRLGADWFLDCLVDADLAVNTLNWQWVAGTGLDAAPFFRIFNPVLQSKKYDKEGTYIKTYVPELKELPARYVHTPWLAPETIRQASHVQLGENYPAPCIDLHESAKAALAAYDKTAG